MVKYFVLPAIVAMGLAAGATASQAKPGGCIKGAVVGGTAGHFLHHHAVLGAIAGCAYGIHRRHEYNRHLREEKEHEMAPRH
ncbi:MAG TPA: hypothetical protein VND97_08690 [Beijerinckiaceae bacterium]|nr:hypothetical protein [Beijerinckiaceae bacterium]